MSCRRTVPVGSFASSSHVVADAPSTLRLRQLRLPLVEPTELFRRSIGEVTDIVEKEMYTFEDRNGDSLTLRPEGTAGCVRAAIQHNLLFNSPAALWYAGPMFRYERPAERPPAPVPPDRRGAVRLRRVRMRRRAARLLARLWRRLGLADAVVLELNTIGSPRSPGRLPHGPGRLSPGRAG
jgi:histidyl-tRNA synthetase